MTAYYNECDPFAAQWLRNLIAAGLIAPGHVDDRRIEEVRPNDLAGFTQAHFFAGISGWSLALRLAGWPDEWPVWTGSCPCPPFSSAGKEFRCPRCDTPSPVPNAVRTGMFNCIRCDHEWLADARHLWPEFFRLIRQCRPERVLGEQVASADGRTWLDVVLASLEMVGYAAWAQELPACGVGAPHIRERIWWVGVANGARSFPWIEAAAAVGYGCSAVAAGGDGLLAHPTEPGRRQQPQRPAGTDGRPEAQPGRLRDAGELGDAPGDEERQSRLSETGDGWAGAAGGPGAWRDGPMGGAGLAGRAGRARGRRDDGEERAAIERADGLRPLVHAPREQMGLSGRSRLAGNANPWSDLEWLPCLDGKARPTRPGLFPLAHGVPGRVGKLRAAGNAIVPALAAEFIKAAMGMPAGTMPPE